MEKLRKTLSSKFFNTNGLPARARGPADSNTFPRHPKQETKPNSYYNAITIFDAQESIECVKVIDERRIAAGLKSGKVLIWDTLIGRQLHLLHNHTSAVTLLEVARCDLDSELDDILVISAGKDQLISVWNLVTGEMIKCFRLNDNPNVRIIRHVASPRPHHKVITLLCAQRTLEICQVDTSHPQDITLNSQVVGRTNAENDIIEILESTEHIVCVTDKTVDTFAKRWEDGGKLKLDHVDIPLISQHGPLYNCCALLPDGKFAVGTLYGGIYICLLKHRMEPDFFEPLTAGSKPVTRLMTYKRDWMVVVYEQSIHLALVDDGRSRYEQGFACPLLCITLTPSGTLVTLLKDSSRLTTWDLSSVARSRKLSVLQPLEYLGDLTIHDDDITGVEVLPDALVTYAKDSLVIIWRNKDQEMSRLSSALQQRDAMFT